MKKQQITLTLLSAILLVSITSYDLLTDGFLKELTTKLESYNQQLPLEKVYLHIDKPLYKPGEDIWFNAYIVDGRTHQPTSTSEVVYIELIDPKGSLQKRLTLPVRNGRAQGDLVLSDEAPGGIYKVRSYTMWMKNSGPESFFEKELTVQKVWTPKVLMKLDFDREAYGPGDQVTSTLNLKDLSNWAVVNHSFDYVVQLQGAEYLRKSAESDKNGTAHIEFDLPESLTSNDGLLNVMIRHNGFNESISRSIPIVLNHVDLQFFPEGGDLVAGISGQVAFKALNEFGKAADVEGKILDGQGKEIQHFTSFHMGMGAFQLKPQKGETYQAVITQPTGITTVYPLPNASSKGYKLSIVKSEKHSLTAESYLPDTNGGFLVAQVRGTIYHQEILDGKTGKQKITIPLEIFPRGIAQVTLFDPNGDPRAERLVFVNADKKMNVKITTEQESYGIRKPVRVKIQTTNQDGVPIPAHLSLAVVNDQIISHADDKQDNIVSYLLMSSDLKGDIEEPDFYFKEDEPNAAQALDYLLMTQGWRRFTWHQVLEADQVYTYLPEKRGTISGRVVHNYKQDKKGKAEVYLFDLGAAQKSVRVETDPDGSFAFTGIAPTGKLELMAKPKGRAGDWKIVLDEPANTASKLEIAPVPDKEQMLPKFIEISTTMQANNNLSSRQALDLSTGPSGNLNLSLSEDVSQLSEVIVTGMGYTTRSQLASSVTTIQSEQVLDQINIASALNGRVPGVVVTQQSGNTSAASKIAIRCSSSLTSGSSPLFIIDGVPIMDQTNNNFSPLANILPEDVASIQVLKGPAAAALYGSRGANGVLAIQTKRGRYYDFQNYSPYVYHTVNPRKYSVTREFYQPHVMSAVESAKAQAPATLYWAPSITTDATGQAELSFHTSNEVTAYRIISEGISHQGQIGRQEQVFHTQLPFQLTAKMPVYLTFADTVQLPLVFQNRTDQAITGSLSFADSDQIKMINAPSDLIIIPADTSYTLYVTAAVQHQPGNGAFSIAFKHILYPIDIQLEIDVQPKGFPAGFSYSGQKDSDAFSFSLQDAIPGSVEINFSAYPNILGDLMSGVESILNEPYGCFEQTSSSTYPNILVLQFMEETGTVNNEIRKKATDLIAKGYKRLLSFETSQGGFEWFGDTPPHEGLTAYGLMEFVDMKKVYPKVSDDLIERTAKWLIDQADGKGGFSTRSGMDGFRGASAKIQNAYIVYALSEAGLGEIEVAFQRAYNEAFNSKDAYRMALMANASFNLDQGEKGRDLLKPLWDEINLGQMNDLQSESSITRSSGSNLKIETAALILLASLKAQDPLEGPVQELVDYLVSSRQYGRFGTTQATVLSLKALTEYTKLYKRSVPNGNFKLFYNDQPVASNSYQPGTHQTMVLDGLEQYMTIGQQNMQVTFGSKEEALPYTFEGRWHVNTPPTHPKVKVDLQTRLTKDRVTMGATARLTATLTNQVSDDLPMTIALIGIPSGLTLQAWQLKEQLEKGQFDFYEIRKNYLVLYYRGMKPEEKKTLHFDLKAEVPGTYKAPASAAYLYYDDVEKDWEAGTSVVIGH